MNHPDFSAAALQAGVFTPGLREVSSARVLSALLAQTNGLDGNPLVLPIPADAPPEIPRLVLNSPDGSTQLQIALSRSDFAVQRRPGTPLTDIEARFQRAAETLEILLAVLDARPGRLAAIGTFFHRCDEPSRMLAEHFCKERWTENGSLSNLDTFELHAHRKWELLEGLPVNSWVRCKVGMANENGVPLPSVIIERDINTLAEVANTAKFSVDEVVNFFGQASKMLTVGIESFFPDEETKA